MLTKALDIEGPVGRLEAVLMTPSSPPVAAAVLCHAHPLHGGMMHYKLLFRVAKVLQEHGYAVLRFNFRGVGRSEGAHDDGRGEQDDVRAALDTLERAYPGLPIVAGGYSFGSIMALAVGVDDTRVCALMALGFPVNAMRTTAFVSGSTKPRLFVQGELDEFGDGAAIARLVDALPEPKTLVVVPGADHYFNGKLDALGSAVSAWLGLI